jgi:hypothetical protein
MQHKAHFLVVWASNCFLDKHQVVLRVTN